MARRSRRSTTYKAGRGVRKTYSTARQSLPRLSYEPFKPITFPSLPAYTDLRLSHNRPRRSQKSYVFTVTGDPALTRTKFHLGGSLDVRRSFVIPEKVAICVRRSRRREVIFASGKGGRRHHNRRSRRNSSSSISC